MAILPEPVVETVKSMLQGKTASIKGGATTVIILKRPVASLRRMGYTNRNGTNRLASAAVLALSISWVDRGPAVEMIDLPATAPIAKAHRTSAAVDARAKMTVYVELIPGTKLGEVVNLGVFGQLVPGMTCPEAAAILGARGQYAESCTFELPSGGIYVAYEPSSSSGGTFHRRTLYAYPNEKHRPTDRIRTKHLEPYLVWTAAPGVILELIVTESGDNHRAWVLVEGDSVRSINWWSPASLRAPGAPFRSTAGRSAR
jgi:hypothetical protein